jgi:hypothetical protein
LLIWWIAEVYVFQPLQRKEYDRLYEEATKPFVVQSTERNVEAENTRLEWQQQFASSTLSTPSPSALYQAKILRILPNFDGELCLRNVRVHDVVDVMKENVGPAGAYSLCRLSRTQVNNEVTVELGWYPSHALKKV